MKLASQVALVTGAGRGIGKAISESLAAEGATVVLASRTKPELESLQKNIEARGGKAMVLVTDVTDDRQVASLFEAIDRKFGRLDILINNAGRGFFAPVRELPVQELDSMWNLNLRAVFVCTQQAIRRMEKQESGIIVQLSSLAGKNAFVGGSGYAATKWALIGFSRSLMLEVRKHNIRVVTVCPGSVDTSFSPQVHENSEKILSPEDVAETVLAAVLISPRAMVSEIDIRPTNPK